jgi:putative intracellular protease/amidase
MNTMLRNPVLLSKVTEFFAAKKPIGAVCHGTLALARAHLPNSDKSILHGRHVTGLPYYLEVQAYLLTHYLTSLSGPSYQLSTTWPNYVEDEIIAGVGPDGRYDAGPVDILAPLLPGTWDDHSHTFLVDDGQLLTARFWGDTYIFAQKFAEKLNSLPKPE